MAEFGVLKNAYISIASVDLSDHCVSLNVPQEVEANDDTAMGDDTRSNAPGLKNWRIRARFNQDYAAGSVDATLNANLAATVAIEVRPDGAAVSATNPKWTGTGVITSYEPIGEVVGGQNQVECEIVAASDLTRATS